MDLRNALRAHFVSESQRVASKMAVMPHLIAPYKSLGGGWEFLQTESK